MLFDAKHRLYAGTKDRNESDFEFLDRSVRAAAKHVRHFLNHWIEKFPAEDRDELVSRIKFGGLKGYKSATFEIMLYAMLTKLGASIKLHPALENGSSKRPDFLVSFPHGDEFYLEAAVVASQSDAELALEQKNNTILELIDRIDSPNFILSYTTIRNPQTQPSTASLRNELGSWLATLDPDHITDAIMQHGHTAAPKMQWHQNEWEIEITAIPRQQEYRKRGQKTVGAWSGIARFKDKDASVLRTLLSKGKRYGKTTKPLVIALNLESITIDNHDHSRILFGPALPIEKDNRQPETISSGMSDGFWHGLNGPQYTRVSGTWMFKNVSPWTLENIKDIFYFNPWARYHPPAKFRALNYAELSDRQIKWHAGVSLSNALGAKRILYEDQAQKGHC